MQKLTCNSHTFATCGFHPELDDVNSGPHAASIKHDAVLGRGGSGPRSPLRGRTEGLGSGGGTVAFHQHQVGKQGTHKQEEPGQLRSPHGGGWSYCHSILRRCGDSKGEKLNRKISQNYGKGVT